ncbi:MAG: DUF368 domain-containing protein [bacterium]
MFEQIKLILKGGVIGVANIIPGVSGGTMAVVLGIYEDLIEAISNFATNRERRKEYAVLLIKVGTGAIITVIALSWVMDYLLSNYPKHTYLFFIGLIIGSVPSIYQTHEEMKPAPASVMTFFAAGVLIISLGYFFPEIEHSNDINFEYQITVSGLALLLIGGIFAGGSMIVPGISGSFVLVLLGQYQVIIKAIKEFNLILLSVVALGAVTGVWGFAKLIDVLLKKYPKETFYFILGLVIASVYPIFPGLPKGMVQAGVAISLAVLGVTAAYMLGRRNSG